MKHRVLVSDTISDDGVELLRATDGIEVDVKTGQTPEQLAEVIGDYDGLIVRSATKVRGPLLEHAKKLKVIGRAGTGVDNIDLPAASERGIVVMNTPGGNSVAAAEHTIALLCSLARNVAQSNRELREGTWARKKYMGVELAGKSLGILGLGKIGREVARRARGLRMEVLGYDPFVTQEAVRDLGIRVLELDELLASADVVSLHLPKTAETANMIDAAALAKMKRGARLINCARGGLVDEAALLSALESGQLAGAGIDVFASEPPEDLSLVLHPAVVATPHLGASTVEAQRRVGVEIAEKLREFFASGAMMDAVNFPPIGREEYVKLRPVMDLGERLGRFLGQIAEGGANRLEIRCLGVFGEHSLKPLAMAAVKGLLGAVVHEELSYVNALDRAAQRGLNVDESRGSEPSAYAGLLRLTLAGPEGETTVAGTLFDSDGPRLVEVDGVTIEALPEGHMICARNRDVPGVVGRIGGVLGEAGVNIAGIALGRVDGTEHAVSIINVDSELPEGTLEQIRRIPEMLDVRTLRV